MRVRADTGRFLKAPQAALCNPAPQISFSYVRDFQRLRFELSSAGKLGQARVDTRMAGNLLSVKVVSLLRMRRLDGDFCTDQSEPVATTAYAYRLVPKRYSSELLTFIVIWPI